MRTGSRKFMVLQRGTDRSVPMHFVGRSFVACSGAFVLAFVLVMFVVILVVVINIFVVVVVVVVIVAVTTEHLDLP
jgi:hypothetical protein